LGLVFLSGIAEKLAHISADALNIHVTHKDFNIYESDETIQLGQPSSICHFMA